MHKIICFGEVLWDVFPEYKKIGGAPLNVALRLHTFKNEVSIISSIGNDKNGRELKDYIEQQGLSTVYIQKTTPIKQAK
jgi:fructokinase